MKRGVKKKFTGTEVLLSNIFLYLINPISEFPPLLICFNEAREVTPSVKTMTQVRLTDGLGFV